MMLHYDSTSSIADPNATDEDEIPLEKSIFTYDESD